MTKLTLTERLHELMHELPGMPDHAEAQRLNHRGGLTGPRPALRNRPFAHRSFQNASGHHEREHKPRVLVGWQNAVAEFLARRGR